MFGKKTLVIVSGFFDPLHVGHIEYLNKAKKLGHALLVIVNSDKQAIAKKGFVFQSEDDRMKIIKNLQCISCNLNNRIYRSISADDSVSIDIEMAWKLNHKCSKLRSKAFRGYDRIIFAKGGDRKRYEIPEKEICDQLGIEIVDGLGKKIRSSSEIAEKSKKLP